MGVKVLGLVGSHRRLGNCELLAKEALLGARECGADVEMVRLTDLTIDTCDGCMRCVFRDGRCAKNDDMEFLLRTIEGADGLVVAAPTYVLAPAAVVKLVIDRFLMVGLRVQQMRAKPRKAATISVAGREDWNPLGPAFLNLLVLIMQFDLVGSMRGTGAGPGEVLLERSLPEGARRLGGRVALALAGHPVERPTAENACPVCLCDFLRLSRDGVVTCPICGLEGRLAGGGGPARVVFPDDYADRHRWAPGPLARHMQDWVVASRDVYLAKREAIRKLVSAYEALSHWWLPAPRSKK